MTDNRARVRRSASSAALVLASLVAFGVLLYPAAADWFSRVQQQGEVSGYTEQAARLSDEDRELALAKARQYNALMPQGPLRDPFTANASEDADQGEAYALYTDMLRLNGTDVIGSIAYERLGIALPVYHGTRDAVLSRGAGHLFGSSLPVGGPGTHSVLTSHSGLARAALFTPLTEAREGDTFTVTVLGESHVYRVDRVLTVKPDDTEALRIVPGRDLVTLITCVPIGVNSDRLLVQGMRVGTLIADGESSEVPGSGVSVGFPWWAVVYIVGNGLVAWGVYAKPRARSSHRLRGARASLG